MVFNRPIKKRKSDENGEMPSKDSHFGRSKIWIIVLSFLLFSSLLFNLLQHKEQSAQKQAVQVKANEVIQESREPADETSEISGHWYGLCPKNSINSIEDFKRIVDKDPLLSQHFSDFDWKNARTGQHENEIYTHVTYRKNEKIGVTKRLVKLPKGDRYITDGKRWVRMYCGNDYVQSGGRVDEKIDTDLNRLIDRVEETSGTNKERGNKGSEVVPEAETFLLFTVGMAGFALFNFISRLKLNRIKN